MSDLTIDATRTERFNDAVRAFTLPLPRGQAKLLPLKDGIVELRERGASLGLIRTLLATVGIAVSKATIARFLAEVADPSTPARKRARFGHGRSFVQNAKRHVPDAVPSVSASSTPSPSATPATTSEPVAERHRTRGPRVADPRNL